MEGGVRLVIAVTRFVDLYRVNEDEKHHGSKNTAARSQWMDAGTGLGRRICWRVLRISRNMKQIRLLNKPPRARSNR